MNDQPPHEPQPAAADLASGVLARTTGVCRECRQMVDAHYVVADGQVMLERVCPEHGAARALAAESVAWFQQVSAAPARPRKPSVIYPGEAGCPLDCGPCKVHEQKCNLPVFSITNACDLRCPICFTFNRADQTYFMSPDEFEAQLDFVVKATGGVDLVNITGGEPTRHPQLLELLARAKRPEIGRVTVNTNGLTLARQPELAKALADLGVYVVLSLDTLDPGTSLRVHGLDITRRKLQCLEHLERYNVQTTILMVLIGGVNEHELRPILDLVLAKDFVRSFTLQTMTYTGQGGGRFEPRVHIPVDGVQRRLEEASGGRLRSSDFMPLPTAHPLCYGVSYLIDDGAGGLVPFSRIVSRETLAQHLAEGYLLRPSDDFETELKSAIDELWASGEEPGILASTKRILKAMYPTDQTLDVHERQRRAEQMVKTIYVHAHMDEDTYDLARARRCPDQVPVNAEKLIGACNYNLFYRMNDERFWVEPSKTLRR